MRWRNDPENILNLQIIDSRFYSDSEFSWLNLPQKIVKERKIGHLRHP